MFTQTPSQVVVRPQRRIASFTAMCVVEEVGRDELEITKHPVQDGAMISDHAYVKAADLTIKVLFDDDQLPLDEIYKQLLELQASRLLFDVVTGKRIYKNMLMKSLSQTTDAEKENILSIDMALEEIIIVQVEVATVPPRAKQAQPARTSGTQNAGAKSAKANGDGPKRQQSILASARR